MQAPLADREPVEHVIHGDRRVDHYAWMKNKKDPRVKAYLEAENAYADAEMRGTEAFQEKLYQEMLGRIQQTDLSVPYKLRGYEYYTRTEEGKQYPIYCRKKVTSDQRSPYEHQDAGQKNALEDQLLAQLRAELKQGFGAEFATPDQAPHTEKETEASPAAVTAPGPQEGEELLLDLNELACGPYLHGLGHFRSERR